MTIPTVFRANSEPDLYGRCWPGVSEGERCRRCGQPDNCGDCTHGQLTDEQVEQLGGHWHEACVKANACTFLSPFVTIGQVVGSEGDEYVLHLECGDGRIETVSIMSGEDPLPGQELNAYFTLANLLDDIFTAS